MTCPICGNEGVEVLASHGFGGAESVHDLSCGHSATMSQVRARYTAPEPEPSEEAHADMPAEAAVAEQATEASAPAETESNMEGVTDGQTQL